MHPRTPRTIRFQLLLAVNTAMVLLFTVFLLLDYRRELAERAGLHQTYIGLIERGLRNPSLDSVQAIATALETTVSGMIKEAEKLVQ